MSTYRNLAKAVQPFRLHGMYLSVAWCSPFRASSTSCTGWCGTRAGACCIGVHSKLEYRQGPSECRPAFQTPSCLGAYSKQVEHKGMCDCCSEYSYVLPILAPELSPHARSRRTWWSQLRRFPAGMISEPERTASFNPRGNDPRSSSWVQGRWRGASS